MLQEKTKVIQFCDKGVKRRIEKSYYAPEPEWNPTKEIELYAFEDLPELQEQGISFKQYPDITTKGMSTFVRNPIDANEFICLDKYGDYVIQRKEEILIMILGKLGIKDYLVKTEYKLGSGFGKQDEGGKNVDTDAVIAKGSLSTEHKSFTDARLKFHELKYKYDELAPFTPDNNHWEEACGLAKQSGLYDSIIDIINLRMPGNNPKILYRKTKIRIDGDVSFNINIASKLKALAGFKGVSAGCGLFNALDFSAYANGEYETTFIYNFDPERDIKADLEKELNGK